MPGKTIILTGASKGIGLAVAKYLLQAPQSCNLVVLARSQGPLDELKSQYGRQVEILTGDLGKFGLGQRAVQIAQSAFGRLDGLVLNHGQLSPIKKIGDSDVEEWKEAYDLSFFSFVDFVKHALPALRESKGRIIFTSSGAAVTPYKALGAYGSSKAAINHLAMTLGIEEPGVTTISIRPGMVDTSMQQELRDQHLSNMDPTDAVKFSSAHRDGKLLKPEQPGHVIARLAMEAPHDMSGKFHTWNDEALKAFQG